MNQSKLEVIACSFLEARETEFQFQFQRETECKQVIGCGFTFDWMKSWREVLSQSSCGADAELITFRHSYVNLSNNENV